MKKYTISILALTLLLVSCEKDFLERNPETEIAGEDFFNAPGDLKTYTNKFYDYLSVSTADYSTDNMTRYSEGSQLEEKLRGTLSPATVSGGWNWEELRNINYFMANYRKAEGDPEEISHYVGIARYFRARFYIDKIKRFGSAPWFSKPLGTDDEEMLYKNSDPREVVVDSIVKDLEYAAAHVSIETDRTQLSRWGVLAELSRFCLYEGTYRKYHDEIGLDDYETFLQKSADAGEEIINSSNFSLYSTGNPGQDYLDLFAMENLDGVGEVILYIDYDASFRRNQNGVVFDYYWGLSKSLSDSYLMKNGTRFTDMAKKHSPRYSRTGTPACHRPLCPPGMSVPGRPIRLLCGWPTEGITS